MGKSVLRLQSWHRRWKIAEQVFHLLVCKCVIFGIPFFRSPQPLSIDLVLLGFITELVIEKFIKEDFYDNFIFTSCSRKTELCRCTLE